jgi:hypothetical protein
LRRAASCARISRVATLTGCSRSGFDNLHPLIISFVNRSFAKTPIAGRRDYQQKPRARRAERGVWNHKPRQYIRGQGEMATGAADQAARRLSAEDLPVRRSATTSNETFCPSLRLCIPARSTALICTKTSWPPSSGWMKPKPFWPLNHFTVPCAMETSFSTCLGRPRGCAAGLVVEIWEEDRQSDAKHAARPSRSAETRFIILSASARLSQEIAACKR